MFYGLIKERLEPSRFASAFTGIRLSAPEHTTFTSKNRDDTSHASNLPRTRLELSVGMPAAQIRERTYETGSDLFGGFIFLTSPVRDALNVGLLRRGSNHVFRSGGLNRDAVDEGSVHRITRTLNRRSCRRLAW